MSSRACWVEEGQEVAHLGGSEAKGSLYQVMVDLVYARKSTRIRRRRSRAEWNTDPAADDQP